MTPAARIAVVGLACHYSDAHTPAQLWQTVLGRRQAFRRIPPGRLSAGYFGQPGDPDRTYVTHAGVLAGWEFDRSRFAVPMATYRAADHTHWLALHTAAEALADAGAPDGAGLPADEVGVILGNSLTGEFSRAGQLRLRWPFLADALDRALRAAEVGVDQRREVLAGLELNVKQPFPEPNDESLAGALANTIAGRVCNYFDFHGCGYTVDGACSSSLLAVAQAARAVATGELRFALAGGVDLSLDPMELVGFARVGALAVDRMRVYDRQPTGFLPGEGCGIVVLTSLAEARQRGLPVYAELVGWGMSADGAGGLTRPTVAGQVRAMTRAYRMAGVAPAEVALIEGHGTGTAVGDEVELTAFRQLRGPGGRPAALGSVKANIGHTKAAAGIAGLLKAILAVQHGTLPPATGCAEPHELLCAPDVPLRVLAEPEPWPAGPRLASVSALGFGGINAHAVIAGVTDQRSAGVPEWPPRWAAPVPQHDILLLDAPDPAGLAALLAEHADWLGTLSTAELHDLAVASHHRFGTGRARAALVAATPGELATAARAASEADWQRPLIVDDRAGFVLATGAPPAVGLLFPGQAALVRAALPGWAAGLAVPALPAGLVVHDRATDTAIAQPAILRQSLAGLAWLAELGVTAVAATGHSLGELAALVWADAVRGDEALALAVTRGRLMAAYGRPGTTMASIGAPASAIPGLVAGTEAGLAGDNAPRRSTVAGPAEDIAQVLARAAAEGIRATRLMVSHGFHSAAMAAVREPLRQALATVSLRAPRRPVISTVTGRPLTEHTDLAELLVSQLTEPVRFRAAVTALARRCGLLVEVGPGTMLTGLARDCVPADVPVVSLDCAGDPRAHALATAALVASGAGSADAWFGHRPYRPIELGSALRLLRNPCEDNTSPPVESTADVIEPVALPTDDPLLALRTRLASACALALPGITATTSLSRDLHLSSLQVIKIVGDVAAELGRVAPGMPAALADATVGAAAEVLAALPPADARSTLTGVRPWVRTFAHDWVSGRPRAGNADARWTVHAPAGHWLRDALAAHSGDQDGYAVFLTPDASVPEIAAMLGEIGVLRPARVLVVHHDHPAGAAIARSAQAEVPDCASTVLDLPPGVDGFDPALVAATGHRELRIDPDGMVRQLATRVHPLTEAELPVGAGEVCLVTGGLTGITARTAFALAERTHCTLVFLGRRPATVDDQHYYRCDVTDPDAVRDAVVAARAHGPIRALLHGAAVNQPRPLAAIDAAGLRDTLAAKVDGLHNLLRETETELRMVVGYGSIIGRRGLAGQAEYCVANEWLRHTLTRWAADHPACRVRCVEWSVWAEIGMGARMSVLEALTAQGIAPIQPAEGARALLAVASADTPATVLVSGRFPDSATLSAAGPPAPLLRFVEDLRLRTPGVEVVTEAAIALASDPYLADHVVDGVPVLPAVLGLEAVAQAVAATVGARDSWSFGQVDLPAPVTCAPNRARTLRVATLAEPDRVDAVLTDDSDEFTAARLRMSVLPAPPPPAPGRVPAPPPTRDTPHPWYGPLFFHTGRFTRLGGYAELSAFSVRAWVDPTPAPLPWFSAFHAPDLLLGDPGLLDASIHVLLACVPHRLALPVGVGRVTVWRPASGRCYVTAREISHTRDDYVFTVDVADEHGNAVARWEELRLHAVGPRAWPGPLPAELLGPLVSRRLIECGIADRIELRVAAPGLGWDGEWTLPGGYRLAVGADAPVWVASAVALRSAVPGLLARTMAARTGEPEPVAGARARCVREVLDHAGTSAEPEIVSVSPDCVVLGTEDLRVACLVAHTELATAPVAIAVAVKGN